MVQGLGELDINQNGLGCGWFEKVYFVQVILKMYSSGHGLTVLIGETALAPIRKRGQIRQNLYPEVK